jgi:hypothetical protein
MSLGSIFANVTWPALVFYQREHAFWIIPATIVIEFLILRRSLRHGWIRAFGITAGLNVFSAAAGAITGYLLPMPLLPYFGLYWEGRVSNALDLGTFNILSWDAALLYAVLLNTLLEGLLLFTVFHRAASRRCVFWLPLANLASAELTLFSINFISPW